MTLQVVDSPTHFLRGKGLLLQQGFDLRKGSSISLALRPELLEGQTLPRAWSIDLVFQSKTQPALVVPTDQVFTIAHLPTRNDELLVRAEDILYWLVVKEDPDTLLTNTVLESIALLARLHVEVDLDQDEEDFEQQLDPGYSFDTVEFKLTLYVGSTKFLAVIKNHNLMWRFIQFTEEGE